MIRARDRYGIFPSRGIRIENSNLLGSDPDLTKIMIKKQTTESSHNKNVKCWAFMADFSGKFILPNSSLNLGISPSGCIPTQPKGKKNFFQFFPGSILSFLQTIEKKPKL